MSIERELPWSTKKAIAALVDLANDSSANPTTRKNALNEILAMIGVDTVRVYKILRVPAQANRPHQE
ncbi:hypothetical protein AB3X96_18080 [Paraburkholderia sp. BR13439]|uniref:hypothetical protein n=1 Tax=Paraburkholderia sp. BR13439 TaxID=3236996 RepID=UPI0034D015E9